MVTKQNFEIKVPADTKQMNAVWIFSISKVIFVKFIKKY